MLAKYGEADGDVRVRGPVSTQNPPVLRKMGSCVGGRDQHSGKTEMRSSEAATIPASQE